MRFWDSSAIAPLLVDEADSEERESQLREDSDMAVWYATVAELESAINRRRREGLLSDDSESRARKRLALLEESWIEAQPTSALRYRSLRLLRVHSLRAADAFQLAAALMIAREQTRGSVFYTGDNRLATAARTEGFVVD